MRILCRLFGCREGQAPCCDRCGAWLYDYEFRPVPRWRSTVSGWWYGFRLWIAGSRCDVCKKWMRKSTAYCWPYTCSKDCDSKWIPF